MAQGVERRERAREVGARVREMREALALTQIELASRAGLSRDVVIRLEQGKRLPHAPNVRKIAKALGVGAEHLLREGPSAVGGAERPHDAAAVVAAEGAEVRGDRERAAGRADRGRSPRVVLALAHARGDDGEELEEILGGAAALGDLQRLLEASRGGVLAGVGLGDYAGAPRFAPGEGMSDEVEAQRDSRPY